LADFIFAKKGGENPVNLGPPKVAGTKLLGRGKPI